MQPSLFTRIINGEIPSHKIYEDDRAYAFLDIRPITAGHVLVVPKEQIDHLWDIDDDLYLHVMEVSKRVAERITEVLRPVRVGMHLSGFDVPHAHVHVFPMYEGMISTLGTYFDRLKADTADADQNDLAAMAKKLAF